MKATVTFKVNRFDLTKREIREGVSTGVGKTLFEGEARAKELCPVETGNLRRENKTRFTPGALSGELLNEADYAAPVNYGHVTRGGTNVPAQPFFTQAEEHMRQRLESNVAAEVKKRVGGAGA